MEDATSNHHPVLAQSSLEASNGAATTGGFIALDVAALSSLAGDDPDTTATAPAASTPRTPRVVRSLSRKGSERKQADGDATNGATGGGGGERPLLSPLLVHVAAGDEMLNGFRLVNTPGGAGTPGGKSRRLGRRPAPWLDPRRVVFLFATLSSVGTLILLYFTLSMTKMDGAGSGTSADSDAR